jgi:hypothetical protein
MDKGFHRSPITHNDGTMHALELEKSASWLDISLFSMEWSAKKIIICAHVHKWTMIYSDWHVDGHMSLTINQT